VDILTKPNLPAGVERLRGNDYTWPVVSSVGQLTNDGAGNLSWNTNVGAYAADLGDGATNPITVTHNLNTRDVVVAIRETSGSFTAVDARVLVTSVNALSLTFDVIPTASQYRVLVFAAVAQAFPVYAATLDFADGDTLKRFTITNSAVLSTSRITGTIRRPNIADVDDPGYLYIANVVSIVAGSFDVLVAATGAGLDDMTLNPPLGSVEFDYHIG
jgi:ribosomal protein S18